MWFGLNVGASYDRIIMDALVSFCEGLRGGAGVERSAERRYILVTLVLIILGVPLALARRWRPF